jgi:hypothetical protein
MSISLFQYEYIALFTVPAFKRHAVNAYSGSRGKAPRILNVCSKRK